jgi:YVTN family beta-propeller protein
MGVSVTSDGTKAYVVNGYDNNVSVINAATNTAYDTVNVSSSPVAFGQFIGNVPPIVTSISPTSGPADGGTRVNIFGTDFTGTTVIDFGTSSSTPFTVLSDTQISATAPSGTGTVDVTVTTPAGTSATSPSDQYTYTAPSITGNSRIQLQGYRLVLQILFWGLGCIMNWGISREIR